MQISDLPLFWRISKLDGVRSDYRLVFPFLAANCFLISFPVQTVWLVTFLSVVILDIDLGLIAGISISILTLLIRLAM